MVKGLDIHAFTDGVLKGWWQYALIVIVVTSAFIGLVVVFWECWKSVRNHRKVTCLDSNTAGPD